MGNSKTPNPARPGSPAGRTRGEPASRRGPAISGQDGLCVRHDGARPWTAWPRSSGLGPSGLGPSGLGPSGLGPSGLGPSGLGPSGLGPSGLGPSGLGPSGLGPSGLGP